MEYEQKVKNLELELQHCKAYISKQFIAFQEKLEQKENTIREMREIMRQRVERMENQRLHLDKLTQVCTRNKQDREELEATIEQKNSTIEQKDNEIHNLSMKVEQQKADIAYFQQAAMNSNNTVNEQKNKIERYQQRIIQLENENARFSLMEQNSNIATELRNAQREITSLKKTIEDKECDHFSSLGKIDSLKKRNANLEADLQKAILMKNQSEQVDGETVTRGCKALIAEMKNKQDSLSTSVHADMAPKNKQKAINYLELMIERLEDIIETIQKNKNTTDQIVEKLEKEIKEFREKAKKKCSICWQTLIFVECKNEKCDAVYHGECIHRRFIDQNAARCVYCTQETVDLAFEFVPV